MCVGSPVSQGSGILRHLMENMKYHGDSNEQNLPLETSSEQRQNDFIISTFAFRDPFILKKIMKFSMIGL